MPFKTQSDLTTYRPGAIDGSIIVRLHFVEAMAVLLFNALDKKQQNSIKQGFQRLLTSIENISTAGVSPDAMQAYKNALSAMDAMLSSNPEPEELAVALGGNFVQMLRR